MLQVHRDAIQRNFSSLMERTDLNVMALALFEREVITRAMYEVYCNENLTVRERKRLLYLRIMNRGPDAFDQLLDALGEKGHWDLVRELDPNSSLHTRPTRSNMPNVRRMSDAPEDSDENSYVSLKSENRKIKYSNPGPSERLSGAAPVEAGQSLPHSNNGQDAIDLPLQVPKFHVKKSTKFVDEDKTEGMKLYRTRGRHRGALLLLSFVKFKYGMDEERLGADVDTANLKHLFGEMGFKVLAYENLQLEEMRSTLSSLPHELSAYETVFTVVASHGYERRGLPDTDIRCGDGGVITDTEIIEYFDHKKMPKLTGVPKVFIFQVCRGSREDYVEQGGAVRTDSQRPPPPAGPAPRPAPPALPARRLPQYSDTLVVHSTVPGTVSHRDTRAGSWYIQALCEVFAAHAHDCHVDMLFKKVDELMQSRFHIQTSSVDSRGFNKKLYLHPGLFE